MSARIERIAFDRAPADERFPNSGLPLIVMRGTVAHDTEHREGRLAAHGWSNAWRGPLYGHHHYHSNTHEALLLLSGLCAVRFGGPDHATDVTLTAGDMALVPAGLTHKLVDASDDYCFLGVYPGGAEPDYGVGDEGERPAADRRIDAIRVPACDPFGGDSIAAWRR